MLFIKTYEQIEINPAMMNSNGYLNDMKRKVFMCNVRHRIFCVMCCRNVNENFIAVQGV